MLFRTISRNDDPPEQDDAVDLMPLPGVPVTHCWWLEGGQIHVHTEGAEHPLVLRLEWNDNKTEHNNLRAARKVVADHFRTHARAVARVRSLIDAARARCAAGRNTPAPSFADFFADFPEGDFKWDGDEAGDWQPYYCDDCDTYHKTAQAIEIERADGKLSIVIRTCDEDGNWGCDGSYDEGDEGWDTFWRENFATNDHGAAWGEYHLWCAENPGKGDPLEDFFNRESSPSEHLKAAREYVTPFRRRARKAA